MKTSNTKKLPLDVQAFEKMRGENYLYVDKTRHIHKMISEGTYYFLSRPRRFGKSLFVSTLKCFFEGRKELFEGLWIAERGEWDWQEHPIVYFDFSNISNETPESLERDLARRLKQQASLYNLEVTAPSLMSQFTELILDLHKQTQMPVVVLIDEYDKPIIDQLGKGDEHLEIAKANRDRLKSFFGILKSLELSPILRCVFLTGISRFSKVSIFSDLNNLIDLSMSDAYADILGYTQQELEDSFQTYIEQLSEKCAYSREQTLQALTQQYNGYRFCDSEVRVYNPFSILHTFNSLKLRDYWFQSATPSFLIDLLKEKQYALPKLEGLEVTEAIFATFDLDRLRPAALLFQTGYLTIANVDGRIYTLDYPNLEVKRAFSEFLFFAFVEDAEGEASSHVLKLGHYLREKDFEAFFETMRAIFASIPYTLNTQRDEAYFHTIFYLMLSASGVEADCEVLTSEGRIDLAVEFQDTAYILEFKCNQNAETAIKQIQDKGYADKYRQKEKQIVLVGINFDVESRNVSEWKIV
ncbi:MAG: ATP-binding protein [bacterium]|nr:ATP-binding protein [bacterium]